MVFPITYGDHKKLQPCLVALYRVHPANGADFFVSEHPKMSGKNSTSSIKVSKLSTEPTVSRDSVSYLTKTDFRRWLLQG